MNTAEFQKGCQNSRLKNSAAYVGVKDYLPAMIAIVCLVLLGQILSPGFASFQNLCNILNMASILVFICIGQLIVILGGNDGIDLSVGAVVSMGALIGPSFINGKNSMIVVGILCVLLMGALIGLVNGVGTQVMRIPALAMTLFVSTVVDGLTLALTRGLPSLNIPSGLLRIGKPLIGSLCPILLIMLVLAFAAEFFLRRTVLGKSIYLVGNNRNASRMCGIHVMRVAILTYVMSGAAACFAGLMLVGYVGSGQLKMGADYTMMSVAAVVIGGAKVTGGKGSLVGGVLGSIVLILLNSVLVAIGLPEGVRQLIQGAILLLVLMGNSRLPSLHQ